MAYDITYTATDDADWQDAFTIIDDDTGQPTTDQAVIDASIDLVVTDCGQTVLSASTADLTITKPDDTTFIWRFTKAQLEALCVGRTYGVGIVMTIDGDQLVQLVSGSLVFKDGSRP